MTERELNERPDAADLPRCPACGAHYDAGDRFCARCGAALAGEPVREARPQPGPPAAEVVETEMAVAGDAAAVPPAKRAQDPIWLFGAPPRRVAGGGVLLILLALALLIVGQRDHTGTIVMLSICLAPLALLTLAIGVVRWVAGRG